MKCVGWTLGFPSCSEKEACPARAVRLGGWPLRHHLCCSSLPPPFPGSCHPVPDTSRPWPRGLYTHLPEALPCRQHASLPGALWAEPCPSLPFPGRGILPVCDVGLSPLPGLGPLGHCCVPRVPQPCCSTWQVPIPLPCPERKVHLPCELGHMLGVIPQPSLESVLVPLTEGQEHGGEQGWDCLCARWAGVGAAHVHVEAPGPPWSAHRAGDFPSLAAFVSYPQERSDTHHDN